MTANQINYLKQIEEHRSNVAQETETRRANLAREAENARANTLNYQASVYSTEAGMRNADVNAETQRVVAGIHANASIVSAAISADASKYASDMNRGNTILNITSTQRIKANELGEAQRHNKAVEEETARHQQREDRSRTWSNVLTGAHNFVSDVINAGNLGVKAMDTLMNTKARRVS
jgi:hypothetical protein